MRGVMLEVAGRRARTVADMRGQKAVHVARRRHLDLGMPSNDAVEQRAPVGVGPVAKRRAEAFGIRVRSEEHTSELQSLMRISYAVFCLKKKKKQHIYGTRLHD